MTTEDQARTTVRIERVFAAPATAVFDAWLNPAVLRQWWPAGPDWETPVAEVDPRVGGWLRLVMRSPDGAEFGGEGRYLEIARPTRLVHTWRWDSAELGSEAQRVEVTFSQNPDGSTTVVLVNAHVPEAEVESHEEGWQASFDNLDAVLLAERRPR